MGDTFNCRTLYMHSFVFIKVINGIEIEKYSVKEWIKLKLFNSIFIKFSLYLYIFSWNI